MSRDGRFEIFLATAPGLEEVLCAEVRSKGFNSPRAVPGGVTIKGGWPEVWRANLWVRGAGRVLAVLASFRALHLPELKSDARKVPWREVLRPDVPFRVEATCSKSRIYHSGAAAERIETAIRETLGATPSPEAQGPHQGAHRARPLHAVCRHLGRAAAQARVQGGGRQGADARDHGRLVSAPMRLRRQRAGLDPMCGSGTFVIEAAEIAARLNPGRARAFAFEHLATFDAAAWARMREVESRRTPRGPAFYGSDRDAGAIDMAQANAERAGVAAFTEFRQCPISDVAAPEGPPGLVIANPPYGARLGDRKALVPLYRALGQTLLTRFPGWRAAIVTTDPTLARATGLPFLPPAAPVPHGGLRVTLYQTAVLP